jgi:hypothetical protein
MSTELQHATYAIMANVKVNWASVMFDVLKRIPTTFLPFGCFLTKIFDHFKVDLESEKNMIEFNEIMDLTMVTRMKLGNIQIPTDTGDIPTSSSAPPPSPQPHATPSHAIPQPTPPLYPSHLDDSYYHTLLVQVANLTTGQGRLFDQQETILKNQQDLNMKVDDLSEMLRNHFFPPPPPPSSS